MDACRASSCCHGARSVPWTEVPAVPLAKAMRAVPVPVQAVAAAAGAAVPRPAGVRRRRWRSWISSPQRRPMRPSIHWTNEPSLHSTTSPNIFSTDSPLTGKFHLSYTNRHITWFKIYLEKKKEIERCKIYFKRTEKNMCFHLLFLYLLTVSTFYKFCYSWIC